DVQKITYTNGVIDTMEDRFTNTVTFNRTSGVVSSITSTQSLNAVITRYSTGRIQDFTATDGAKVTLSFNPFDELMYVDGPATASFPSGIHEEYRYTNGSSTPALNGNLISATDGAGTTWMTLQYDAFD